jgi:antirestriction protein
VSNVPSNSDDIIDSRDVIERIAELEAVAEEGDSLLDRDERIELGALWNLADEASGYAADWEYGETLIRDSYFVTYAQQLAEDIGAVNPDAGWPNSYIDWERAAEALRMDYTSVDFDGVTYWVR